MARMAAADSTAKRAGITDASYYFLFDGLGSVTEVVDGSENTQNSYRYEAWGQVKSSTENITNPYRYIGAYGVHWDPSPALYFMQARYYAPDIGRFITPDPVRGAMLDPISLYRYLYVKNNPATLADPIGLQPAGRPMFPPGVVRLWLIEAVVGLLIGIDLGKRCMQLRPGQTDMVVIVAPSGPPLWMPGWGVKIQRRDPCATFPCWYWLVPLQAPGGPGVSV